ncbi:MAG: TonB-dependent receptor [Bacteroidota bacterium]
MPKSGAYAGYAPQQLDNIVVTSAKEVILNVAMEQEIAEVEMEGVDLVAQRGGEVRNEMAKVSARQFSVEETNLYAGSRGEPARMASNYAGVQGGDDSRNDIVVRGNSPSGVLWRLEGINIPNPNHFAIPGTGGGPVTILNNKFLANSDFYTGAFPAEFGNGIAGVFDLRMRNGNNEKHEFSGQLGFLGTELTAEGPLSKKSGASYLVMYRYSTLALFSGLNINVGTDAIPRYQDGAFRLNFPLKNGASLAFWGMGGLSDVDIVLSEQEGPSTDGDLFASNQDRDQYFGTNTGIAALTYTHPVNVNTYFKASVAVSRQTADTYHEQIYRRTVLDPTTNKPKFVVDSLPPILDYRYTETKYSAYFKFNRKLGRKASLNAGINLDYLQMDYLDSVRIVVPQDNEPARLEDWRVRWNADQGAALVQPYVQFKYRASDRLEMVAGLSSLYWGLNNNSFSPIEPRLGISYDLGDGQKLSYGAGLHSQIQSPYLYFFSDSVIGSDVQEYNLDLGLTKSIHNVLSYDLYPGKFLHFKAEVYFQYLYGAPVEEVPSSFSLLNAGSGFSRFFPPPLVNTGRARNYGLELTMERFFSGGYYFLATGSLFDAKYWGSDGVLRNATFNGRYAVNGLFAKEWTLKKGSAFNLGVKATSLGGRWAGEVDEEASDRELEVIFKDKTFNTIQFRPYFRLDLKAAFRLNTAKFTHELAIDFVNVTNQQNILTLTYVPDHPSGNPVQEEYQLGFLPLFYYKIDF